jgi:hypothetical protein
VPGDDLVDIPPLEHLLYGSPTLLEILPAAIPSVRACNMNRAG